MLQPTTSDQPKGASKMLLCGTAATAQILGVQHDDLHCCPSHSSAESKGFLGLLCRLLLENALVGNPLLFLYACVRSHYISATVLNLQAIGVQHDVQH